MVLAALAAFAGAAVQSASGLGFALVLSPALFAVMDPEEAVTAVLLLGAALCALVLVESHASPPTGSCACSCPRCPAWRWACSCWRLSRRTLSRSASDWS